MNNKFNYREHFPFFDHASRASHAYLDNAATTHKPATVIDVIQQFYRDEYATVHRGLYQESELATVRYEHVRAIVAQFINAQSELEIVFTKGTTESINCFAWAWAFNNLEQGDEIIITQAEHHANLVPWQEIAQRTGAKLVFVPLDTTTYLLQNPEALLTSRTKLVSVAHHSNVLGALWPEGVLESFITKAKGLGAVVLLDMAQCVAHHPVDVQKLLADAIVFSGHKVFGPTGVGVLYVHQRLHSSLAPYQLGGAMVSSVSWHRATYKPFPYLLEAGTPPIAQVLGLGAALDYMNESVNFSDLKEHERALCGELVAGLSTIPGMMIFGNRDYLSQEGHLVSFAVDGVHAHDIAAFCATRNVAVRAGHHCAQPLVSEVLKQSSAVRASLSIYNTSQDVQLLIAAVKQAISILS